MSKTVLVGCKLPSGIELDGPSGVIMINGANSSLIHGGFGLTHVLADEWAYLVAMYASHAAFANNAIFTTGTTSVADIAALGDDLSAEKTGFEGLDPKKPGPGLIPEDPNKLNKQLNENAERGSAPKKVKLTAADKAAAREMAQGAA